MLQFGRLGALFRGG